MHTLIRLPAELTADVLYLEDPDVLKFLHINLLHDPPLQALDMRVGHAPSTLAGLDQEIPNLNLCLLLHIETDPADVFLCAAFLILDIFK